jgi:Tfp pilus assembly protein PilF
VTAALLVLLVCTAFAPCLSNGFVNWDDDKNFLKNPGYRGLGWSQVCWDWTSFQLGVYQPLAWMILGTQWLVWGLRPWGYHLTSLVLHALDTVVLFVLTLSLRTRCRQEHERPDHAALVPSAGLAVALFAVHPLRTEVVAWASCQPYLPCALFAMLAVLAYLRAFPEQAAPRRGWLIASFCLLAAALLSKAVAVGLPLLLLILDVHPLRRLGGGPGRWFGPSARAVWWEKMPFAGLSLVFVSLAIAGRVPEGDLAAVPDRGIAARFAQACYAIMFYPLKTVLPWNLTAYYPVPERLVWYELPFVASILATLAVSVGLFLLRRRVPGLLAAWLSYLVILAPNLGLVRSGAQIAADRYSYIALMPLVVAVAAALGPIRPVGRPARAGTAVGTAASLGVLLGLILLSRDQCRTWRSSLALSSHAVNHGSSRSYAAHSSLGLALFDAGRLADAEHELAEALRINPRFADAHNNLGMVLQAQGRHVEARAEFAAALRLNPRSAEAHNNQGVLLRVQGRLEDARAEFIAALRIDRFSAIAHTNLGVLLARQGRLAEAWKQFSTALWIKPDHAEAHNDLGVLLSQQGRLTEAEAEFRAVLRINPGSADAHNNLGVLLGRLGQLERARREFSDALRINPGSADAHNNLGVLLAREGRLDDALGEFSEALRINRDYADAHNNRGMVLLRQGRLAEARAEFSEAERLNPAFAEAHAARELARQAWGGLESARAQVGDRQRSR